MPTLTHVHTYTRYWPNRWKNKDLYKCDDPGCTHVQEKSMILGKYSLCTACHKEMILDYEALKRVKPRCLACTNTKRGKEARAVRDLIASMNLEPTIVEEDNKYEDPTGGID